LMAATIMVKSPLELLLGPDTELVAVGGTEALLTTELALEATGGTTEAEGDAAKLRRRKREMQPRKWRLRVAAFPPPQALLFSSTEAHG
jgi:hypothetical protein